MPLSNFKKILFAGTALVAVSAFSTQASAGAPDRLLTGAGTWASAGTKLSSTAIASAMAGNKVDGASVLTVTNDGTADDGSANKNTFVIGAVGSITPIAGFTTVNGSANDLTVTAASVIGANSPISISNTGFVANANATTITGVLTNSAGTLKIKNASTAAAKAVSLTVGGTATVAGATTITAGAVSGADATLTLNGTNNVLTGLVTLVDGAAGLAKVVVTGALAEFTNGIKGTAAGKGTLTLGNTALTAVVGATNKLLAVNFTGSGASSVSGATSATTVTVSGAGTVTQTGALTATSLKFTADGAVVMGANLTAAVTTATTNKGTLTLNGTSTVAGQVGTSTNVLKLVNGGANGAVTTFANDIFATNLKTSGTGTILLNGNLTGKLDFSNKASTVKLASGKAISGNIISSTGVNGTLELLGDANFAGSITGVKTIKAGVNAKTVSFTTDISATNLTFTGSGIVTLASGKNLTAKVGGSTAGTLTFLGGTQTSTGIINNNALLISAGAIGATTTFASAVTAAKITAAGTGNIALKGAYTGIVDFKGNAATVTVTDAKTITGTVNSTVASAGTLTFLGDSTVSGAVGATNALTTINANGVAGKLITFQSTVKSTTLNFAADSKVTMSANNLTAAVTTTTTNKGTLTFGSTNQTMTGQVGTSAKMLKEVNGGASSSKTIFMNDVYATTLKTTGSGHIELHGNLTGNVDFASTTGNVEVSDGKTISGNVLGTAGTLKVLGTSTFAGTIAGSGLEAGYAGKTATFNGNITASQIKLVGAAGIITLNGTSTSNILYAAAGTVNINKTLTGAVAFAGNDGVVNLADAASISLGTTNTTTNKGTLNIAGASTLGALGGSAKLLKAINVNGASGKTVTFGGVIYATTLTAGAATSNFSAAVNATTLNLGAGAATFSGLGTGALNFTADGTAIAKAGWTGAVTTATANTGSLTFNTASGGVTTTIGTTLKPLKKLILAKNLTTTGAVNAKTIEAGTSILTTGAAFTLASGQTLSVTPAGAGSTVHSITTTASNAVGNVTFASGSSILISPTGTIAKANVYDIAIASGTALTNAATIESGIIGWSFSGAVVGKTLRITPAAVAITSNNDLAQVQISKGTGTVATLAASITAATTLAAKNNLREAALPTVDGSAVFSLLDSGAHVTSVIETRMASIRSGNASGMAAGYGAKGDNAWIQGYANSSNQNKRKGIAGYNSNLGGIALGYDSGTVIDGGVFGVAFNYGRTSADSDNANTTSTDINSYGFNVYANIPLQNKIFLDAQIGYTFDDLQIDRHNAGGAGLTANGDTTANQYAAKLSLGRDYATTSGMTITPDVSASWLALDTSGYTEKGTGTLLAVGNQRFNALDLGVGAKATWETKNHDGSKLRPEIKIGYAYDLIGDAVDVSSNFVAVGTGAAFKTNGLDPSRSKFDAGLGFTYASPENWDLSAKYDYVYKADYESHNGSIRLTSHF